MKHAKCFLWFLGIFSGLISGAFSQVKRPAPDLLFLENEVVKVGIDRAMGASLTWLSWAGQDENAINIHDPGRLIQQSYYAGKVLDRTAQGQHKRWSPWSWNPIQGGGVGSWSRVTLFEKKDGRGLISETIPKLWDMLDEDADAIMKQATSFEPRMPRVISVRNELVCQRKPDDPWGAAIKRHQELPAIYLTRGFSNFESYLGHQKWRLESAKVGPPWSRVNPPMKAMACFRENGQGLAVYCPVADTHWNFGPHGKNNPLAKSTDGECVHLAPLATLALGPQSKVAYRYWLLVGTRAQIATDLDRLILRYRGEKITMVDVAK